MFGFLIRRGEGIVMQEGGMRQVRTEKLGRIDAGIRVYSLVK
jgi:hypothetical protein